MPSPSPVPAAGGRSRAPLTRRAGLLGLAALAGTTACTGPGTDRGGPASRGPSTRAPAVPAVDPDVRLAATVLAQEQEMVARVDATVAAYPRLERSLAATRAVHTAHVALLTDAAPSPAPSPTAPGGNRPFRVAATRRSAVLALARRERDLGVAAKQSAFAAESGAFARVLASMAAAAAQQSVTLRGLAGGPS